MKKRRTERLNSLLREVINDVIRKEVKNPQIHELFTITRVEISKDLHYAKVYFSVLGSDKDKKETLKALQSASGFIGMHASKQISIRFFPSLTFYLDESLEKQYEVDRLLNELNQERKSRLQDE